MDSGKVCSALPISTSVPVTGSRSGLPAKKFAAVYVFSHFSSQYPWIPVFAGGDSLHNRVKLVPGSVRVL